MSRQASGQTQLPLISPGGTVSTITVENKPSQEPPVKKGTEESKPSPPPTEAEVTKYRNAINFISSELTDEKGEPEFGITRMASAVFLADIAALDLEIQKAVADLNLDGLASLTQVNDYQAKVAPKSRIGQLKAKINQIRMAITSPMDAAKKKLIAIENYAVLPLQSAIDGVDKKRRELLQKQADEKAAAERERGRLLELVRSVGPFLDSAYAKKEQEAREAKKMSDLVTMKNAAEKIELKVPSKYMEISDQYMQISKARLDQYKQFIATCIANFGLKEVEAPAPTNTAIAEMQVASKADTVVSTPIKGHRKVAVAHVDDWTQVDAVTLVRYLTQDAKGLDGMNDLLKYLPPHAKVGGVTWTERDVFSNRS